VPKVRTPAFGANLGHGRNTHKWDNPPAASPLVIPSRPQPQCEDEREICGSLHSQQNWTLLVQTATFL